MYGILQLAQRVMIGLYFIIHKTQGLKLCNLVVFFNHKILTLIMTYESETLSHHWEKMENILVLLTIPAIQDSDYDVI